MDPKDVLRHIRTLIKAVAKVDDIVLIHRHLKDVLVLVEKGLAGTGNVIPIWPGVRGEPEGSETPLLSVQASGCIPSLSGSFGPCWSAWDRWQPRAPDGNES